MGWIYRKCKGDISRSSCNSLCHCRAAGDGTGWRRHAQFQSCLILLKYFICYHTFTAGNSPIQILSMGLSPLLPPPGNSIPFLLWTQPPCPRYCQKINSKEVKCLIVSRATDSNTILTCQKQTRAFRRHHPTMRNWGPKRWDDSPQG